VRSPRPLWTRCEKNPILTRADWPYPVHSVFNPGATLLPDGTTLLLCRVEDFSGRSHLCAARSADGVSGWTIDGAPTLERDPERAEELWGVEDPRITFLPELGRYAVTYTAFGKSGPGVALALTRDFREFERCGLVMQPDDKDAALLPRRIRGLWAMLHRPMTDASADVWISYSPDLRNWGGHEIVLRACRGGWWDANKIRLSPPLIETPAGWLMLYHGVRRTASGSIYRVGAALLDLEAPERCRRRGASWIFGPEAPYEISGDVAQVVFPCGVTQPDADTLAVSYGAADPSSGLARTSLSAMLDWLQHDDSGEF